MDLFPWFADRRKQLAGTLSGGQQPMLAIGRALVTQPRLLMGRTDLLRSVYLGG